MKKIIIGDKSYSIDMLDDEGKAHLASSQFVDGKIAGCGQIVLFKSYLRSHGNWDTAPQKVTTYIYWVLSESKIISSTLEHEIKNFQSTLDRESAHGESVQFATQ